MPSPRYDSPTAVPLQAPALESNPASDAALRQQMRSAAVLVVDDHEQNRELLIAYLEDLGCAIHAAGDGVEAVALIEQTPPDLILLDVMMPRMSGFQLCSKLKSDPATRDIPVIMVTALSEVGDIERAVESGADDFLTKPVHKIELLTRVRSLLRVRLLRAQLERAMREMRQVTASNISSSNAAHPSTPPPTPSAASSSPSEPNTFDATDDEPASPDDLSPPRVD